MIWGLTSTIDELSNKVDDLEHSRNQVSPWVTPMAPPFLQSMHQPWAPPSSASSWNTPLNVVTSATNTGRNLDTCSTDAYNKVQGNTSTIVVQPHTTIHLTRKTRGRSQWYQQQDLA